MPRTRTIPFLLATMCAFGIAQAHAVQRAHVSASFGTDANTASNCTVLAPCRTFQAAIKVTDTNGEVIVLDSGEYGAVTITRSVALIAPTGVYAGIYVSPDIDKGVSIDTPRISVVIRGITINGQGGSGGISMTQASRLTVENCVISNLVGSGISVYGNVYSPAVIVRVTDTIIRDNGRFGIVLQNGAQATITRSMISGHIEAGVVLNGFQAGNITSADIADSTIDGNGDGVFASIGPVNSPIKVSVRDSRLVGNKNYALRTDSVIGSLVSLTASNNLISNNANGIGALSAGSRVWASGNTVSDNTNFGLQSENGALFESAGNNAVRNNGTNKSGIISAVATE
jgi:Right handed beta helix region